MGSWLSRTLELELGNVFSIEFVLGWDSGIENMIQYLIYYEHENLRFGVSGSFSGEGTITLTSHGENESASFTGITYTPIADNIYHVKFRVDKENKQVLGYALNTIEDYSLALKMSGTISVPKNYFNMQLIHNSPNSEDFNTMYLYSYWISNGG